MQPIQTPRHVRPQLDPYDQEMLNHARRTANAAVFIAWVVAISVVLSVVVGAIMGVQLAKVGNAVNTGTSTCQSLGGTDPSC